MLKKAQKYISPPEAGLYMSTFHLSTAVNVSDNSQILPFRLAGLHLEFLVEVLGCLGCPETSNWQGGDVCFG